MFASLFAVVPRLLLFRAGPQDLPFSAQITPWLIAFAVFANLVVLGQAMPLLLVVLISLLVVGAVALVTHAFLRSRNFGNRFNQTFNALLLTGGVLTLLMAPLFSFVVPALKVLAADPELMQNPEALGSLRPPVIVSLLLDLLFVWHFAVSVHIYRQAGELRLGAGVLLTLALVLFTLFTVSFGIVLFGGLLPQPPSP